MKQFDCSWTLKFYCCFEWKRLSHFFGEPLHGVLSSRNGHSPVTNTLGFAFSRRGVNETALLQAIRRFIYSTYLLLMQG